MGFLINLNGPFLVGLSSSKDLASLNIGCKTKEQTRTGSLAFVDYFKEKSSERKLLKVKKINF